LLPFSGNPEQIVPEGIENLKEFNDLKQLKEVFPSTNFWGRINSINQWQANKMGVKYIVSDHNINLKSKVLQSKIEKIVIPKNSLIIPFTSEDNTIEEVRFLAANFNRRNTCTLELVLFENTRLILKREVRCQNTKDKMFLTIELGKVQLKKGVPYEFKLTLKNSNKKNSIGFWSNQSGTPYFELLYSASDTFKNIWTGEGVSLFINEHNNLIEGFDTYSVIRNEQTKFVVKGNASESRTVTIKKTNYPGWNVLLNGKEVPQKDNTFFKVPIEKGEHVIELLYTPFSLIVGVLVSAITALLMILSFIKHYQLKVIFEKPKNKNDIRNICILSFSISLIV
jgi:hypothetical protein